MHKINLAFHCFISYSVQAPIGGIAQLGERLTGSQEVRGSIPLVSTIATSQPLVSRGCFIIGLMAQWLAQGTHNPWVVGSNPTGPTIVFAGQGICSDLFIFEKRMHLARNYLLLPDISVRRSTIFHNCIYLFLIAPYLVQELQIT